MKRLPYFVAIALLVVGVWSVTYRPANPDDVFLGYVEGDILYIGPYESERVASLAVAAGSVVKNGDPLFAMSTTLLDRARDEATARVAQLEAQAENLQAAMNRP